MAFSSSNTGLIENSYTESASQKSSQPSSSPYISPLGNHYNEQQKRSTATDRETLLESSSSLSSSSILNQPSRPYSSSYYHQMPHQYPPNENKIRNGNSNYNYSNYNNDAAAIASFAVSDSREPPLINQFEIDVSRTGAAVASSNVVYPERRSSVGMPMPLAASSGSVSQSSTGGSSYYRKLTQFPSAYSKDKRRGFSFVEKYINRYNRRLSASSRAILCSIVAAVVILSFLFIHLSFSSFIYRITLSSIVMSLGAILFSFWLLTWILKFNEGTPEMKEVAGPIHEGSEGFFIVQYGAIAKIASIFAVLIFIVYILRDPPRAGGSGSSSQVSSFSLAVITSTTFMFGALCSALSGYSGIWVSVRTNVRVTSAARRCYNDALQLCFRGGAFSSIVNVALAVGGIAAALLTLNLVFPNVPFVQLPLLLVGYGFGASLVAMFAQLGGGIFTKAADIGADLVGKIEAGIPEDDPRNPAVVADLVGDNVGDCAGQCADLFESIAAEIISAMILGGALANEAKMSSAEAAGFVLFPLAVHCMDLVISSIGVMLVKAEKGVPSTAESVAVDPLKVLIQYYILTCVMGLMGFSVLCRLFLYSSAQPKAWMYYSVCGAIGMVCSFLFVLITQYYTDYKFSKVRRIAEASTTGPATNVIAGLSVGMESTILPVLLISACVISAYYCGSATNLLPEGHRMSGLFGTAAATMGMLCTAVYVLSMSSFGPIADNAGGIAEMSGQEEHVRAVIDRLDAVGNVTKANTKGFSVGSASLACFLLFSAFLDEISIYTGKPFEVIDLSKPEVFIGGLIGACVVLLFCAWALEAVGKAAQQVVKEVRRQFTEYPGIMDYTERPDYHTCVAIVSRSALQEMIRPGLLSILTPIAVGCSFRLLGYFRGNPDLGAQVVASFLMFSTSSGILMALFLNNAGGAWDNAKKYIETGAYGGKNSASHKAAVVGDTVGDPCKDTAGPSTHVYIKLISTVTMVLAPMFVSINTKASHT